MLLRMVVAEGSYRRAKRKKDSILFPPSVPVRFAIRLGMPFLVYAFFRAEGESTTRFDHVVFGAGILAALVAFLFLEPPEIRIGPTGITQRGLFGFRKRQIGWEGMAVSYVPALQEVTVIGNDGTTITHTEYHIGQEEFVYALRSRKVFFHGDKII